MQLHFVDSVIILVSLALVIGAVLRAAGKKQSGSEYFLAGATWLGHSSGCRSSPRIFRLSTSSAWRATGTVSAS